jgi:pyrroline-5-carboxylate reductase
VSAVREAGTIGVLGTGSIAAAMVTGWCDEIAEAPQVLLSPRNARTAAALAERFPTVEVAESNQAVLDGARVVLLCLRVQDLEALRALRFRPDQLVVSVMAATSVATLGELTAPATEIVRAVPLPAVAGRTGVTPVHPPHETAKALFDALGRTVEVREERTFDALSAASATVAAHFAYLAAISAWLEAQGLPAADAADAVAATFTDVGHALATRSDFEALAAEHATVGGLNEQFRRGLEGAGVYDAVGTHLDAVLARVTGEAPPGRG